MLPKLADARVEEGHLLHRPCFYIKEGQESDSEQRELITQDQMAPEADFDFEILREYRKFNLPKGCSVRRGFAR